MSDEKAGPDALVAELEKLRDLWGGFVCLMYDAGWWCCTNDPGDGLHSSEVRIEGSGETPMQAVQAALEATK